jgi:hypothetical protein
MVVVSTPLGELDYSTKIVGVLHEDCNQNVCKAYPYSYIKAFNTATIRKIYGLKTEGSGSLPLVVLQLVFAVFVKLCRFKMARGQRETKIVCSNI